MARVQISPNPIHVSGVGNPGIVLDIPGHQLPPEVWTGGKNVRFQRDNAIKFKGHSSVFGTPTVAPSFMLMVPAQSQTYWIYTSLTKAYVYEGGVHTNITRQTASVDVNYTATNSYEWNGGIFGGIPILNNGSDAPQYWSAISVGTKLANLSNWPSGVKAKVVRPFGPFLIALNITESGGTLRPQMIWWSHRATPGTIPTSWDYTDPTKEAGRKDLTDIGGGDILEGMLLGDYLIVYKETSTHALRIVGGQEIIGNSLILPDTGIMAARCVTPFNNGKGHFVVTADSFLAHSGTAASSETLFEAELRKSIMAEIDGTNYKASFCFTNQAESEVWFCYPVDGSSYPNKAFIWNWKFNTTQFRDFTGWWAQGGSFQSSSGEAWNSVSAAASWEADTEVWSTQERRRVIIADKENTLFLKLDDTEYFNGVDMSCYLERTGLAIYGRDSRKKPQEDFRRRKLVTRVWPKITGTAPVTIKLGAQESRDDPVTWQATGVFDPTTDLYLDLIASGRLIAIRFEATTHLPFTLEGYDLEMALLGEH